MQTQVDKKLLVELWKSHLKKMSHFWTGRDSITTIHDLWLTEAHKHHHTPEFQQAAMEVTEEGWFKEYRAGGSLFVLNKKNEKKGYL
jgi:hypothetical protein